MIAPGKLVVDSNVKKVQHPTGGVVGDLRVKDGDRVKKGDVVVRLDETQARASLAIVTKALDEMEARQARLEAERDGADKVTFPADLLARRNEPEVAQATASEQRLFELRRSAREGQKAQLLEQIDQLRQQIVGNDEQVAAKTKEIDWNQQELGGIRGLWKQNLVPFNRVTTLERDSRAPARRARRADRLDRPGQGPHRRDPAQDPADRRGSAHRGRQGAGRDPRQASPS